MAISIAIAVDIR